MLQRAAFIFALLVLGFMAGCSMHPSESDAKQILENQIQQNSGGFIKLVSFRKTNGIEKQIDGAEGYELEWTATMEFTADCLWDPSNFTAIPPQNIVGALLNLDKQKARGGDKVELSGATAFEKTEKGWRFKRMHVRKT